MKKATRTITGTITELARERSGVSGNPRYRVTLAVSDTETVTAWTAPNSNMAYGITNFESKRVSADVEVYRGRLTLRNLEEVGL